MRKLFIYALLSLAFWGHRQVEAQEIVHRSENLSVSRISDHGYVHVSYLNTEDWGKVACNGMVVTSEGEAVVLDTTVDNDSSRELIQWITDSLRVKIIAVIPTHYHEDNLGGLDEFHRHGIPSYAYRETIRIAEENEEPQPQNGFDRFVELEVGGEKIYAEFLGEGHTCDNTVVYFPSEKILFGGCLVKALGSGKGNLAEAIPERWAETVKNVKNRFPEARIIIPGHGEWGGTELLDYTIHLFQ